MNDLTRPPPGDPPRLVLASGSPRRAELLKQLGLTFDVVIPRVNEQPLAGEDPISLVIRLARAKAATVRQSRDVSSDVVLAADTVVVVDGTILGKPENRDQGIGMLNMLSGNTHCVVSGVAIESENDSDFFHVETKVRFRTLTNEEAARYWQSGEPADKAGGYGIQGMGAIFVAAIQGSYTNVVGLPLAETAATLKNFGIDCLGDSVTANVTETDNG